MRLSSIRARGGALAALAAALTLSGCCSANREQQTKTANLGAGIFELAVALEQGVPKETIIPALKLGSAAIIKAQDHTYAPADDWVKALQAPKPAEGR